MSIMHLLTAMSADRDLWEEADVMSVVLYLRGAKSLVIPPELRDVLRM